MVPAARSIQGPGASYVMAAFTHVSPDRPSRFSDGSYGVYYAGESIETALFEHRFHVERSFSAQQPAPKAQWISTVRHLVGSIDRTLIDLRGPGCETLLDPDPTSYPVPQAFAARERAAGADGICYPSVRRPGGSCIAAFWPDVVRPPIQGGHWRYFWDGARITHASNRTDKAVPTLWF